MEILPASCPRPFLSRGLPRDRARAVTNQAASSTIRRANTIDTLLPLLDGILHLVEPMLRQNRYKHCVRTCEGCIKQLMELEGDGRKGDGGNMMRRKHDCGKVMGLQNKYGNDGIWLQNKYGNGEISSRSVSRLESLSMKFLEPDETESWVEKSSDALQRLKIAPPVPAEGLTSDAVDGNHPAGAGEGGEKAGAIFRDVLNKLSDALGRQEHWDADLRSTRGSRPAQAEEVGDNYAEAAVAEKDMTWRDPLISASRTAQRAHMLITVMRDSRDRLKRMKKNENVTQPRTLRRLPLQRQTKQGDSMKASGDEDEAISFISTSNSGQSWSFFREVAHL